MHTTPYATFAALTGSVKVCQFTCIATTGPFLCCCRAIHYDRATTADSLRMVPQQYYVILAGTTAYCEFDQRIANTTGENVEEGLNKQKLCLATEGIAVLVNMQVKQTSRYIQEALPVLFISPCPRLSRMERLLLPVLARLCMTCNAFMARQKCADAHSPRSLAERRSGILSTACLMQGYCLEQYG